MRLLPGSLKSRRHLLRNDPLQQIHSVLFPRSRHGALILPIEWQAWRSASLSCPCNRPVYVVFIRLVPTLQRCAAEQDPPQSYSVDTWRLKCRFCVDVRPPVSGPQSRLSLSFFHMRTHTKRHNYIFRVGWLGVRPSGAVLRTHNVRSLCACVFVAQCFNTAPSGEIHSACWCDSHWLGVTLRVGQTLRPTSQNTPYCSCKWRCSQFVLLLLACFFLSSTSSPALSLQVNVTVDYIRAATGPGESTPAFSERTCATVTIGGM